MKLCFVLVPILLAAVTCMWAQAPDTLWTKTYGGSAEDWCQAAQQTADGGFIMAGHTFSTGAGQEDFWAVKTNPQGAVEWTHAYGGSNADRCWAVQQTMDGGYILAGVTVSFGAGGRDFWLVKTNAAGTMVWNHTYGGTSNEWATSVEQTPDSGFVVAGWTQSYGAGNLDCWLVKTDANGNMVWNRTYGGSGQDECHAVHRTADGGYVLGGFTYSFGSGQEDYWLVKTDAIGNMVWNHTYGGSSAERCWDAKQTADGGYVMCGATVSYGAGADDFWVVKTNSLGTTQWTRSLGGGSNEWATTVIQTPDGGFAVGGWTQSYGAGDLDMWLVRLNSAGAPVWNKTVGGAGQDEIQVMQLTSDNGYMLAGWTYSYGHGNGDFWLVKLAPDQTLPVELVSFEAAEVGRTIDVRFSTASETDNAYFEIWRGLSPGGEFSKDAQIESQGPSTTRHDYHFTDSAVQEGQTYWYYLVDVNVNGTRTEHRDQMASATVNGAALITDYSLNAYPNPFNPTTTLTLTLPEAARVKVRVYDSLGRLVSELANANFPAGERVLSFNGADLPTGVYVARMETGTITLTQKLLLVK